MVTDGRKGRKQTRRGKTRQDDRKENMKVRAREGRTDEAKKIKREKEEKNVRNESRIEGI